jgi:hypothetical protein
MKEQGREEPMSGDDQEGLARRKLEFGSARDETREGNPPSGWFERGHASAPSVAARVARVDAEIAGAELCHAARLLSHVLAGTSSSTRAAAAGEARDAYESALRHLERVRGTPQEWELRALANEVEEMLAREEGDQTCPG